MKYNLEHSNGDNYNYYGWYLRTNSKKSLNHWFGKPSCFDVFFYVLTIAEPLELLIENDDIWKKGLKIS